MDVSEGGFRAALTCIWPHFATYVRFGSFADIGATFPDVRFTAQNGRCAILPIATGNVDPQKPLERFSRQSASGYDAKSFLLLGPRFEASISGRFLR
jgi:hypothetical protein